LPLDPKGSRIFTESMGKDRNGSYDAVFKRKTCRQHRH
jgi:hypothetical protein